MDLLSFLDEEPWLTMYAIADCCEESGDPHLAAGWRWLAKRKKRPSLRRFWQWSNLIRFAPVHDNQPYPGSWQLPVVAWEWLQEQCPRIGRLPHEFDSCSEAYQCAAEAMASLSQQGIDIENLERDAVRND